MPSSIGVPMKMMLSFSSREQLSVGADEIDREVERFATQAGRTPAAIRAQLEKEGGLARLATGLRREKAVDLALSRARIL